MYKLVLVVFVAACIGCVPPVESNVPENSLNTDAKLPDSNAGSPPTNSDIKKELDGVKASLKVAQEKEKALNDKINKQADELKELNSVISSSKDKLKSILDSFESVGNPTE